ncbi:MAG: PEP-CTERM sorting domain-containing protein [Chthoniobacteraceae bacterium]
MKSFLVFLLSAAVVAILGANEHAFALDDNFNDGNDDGWTHYDPLAAVGADPAVFSFPDGGYRIQASVSPDEGTLGPGRAASFRLDEVFTQFSVQVDVTSWDAALEQAFGLTARMSQIGLGTTNGYGLVYTTDSNDFLLGRIDGEAFETLDTTSLSLIPGDGYRFVFSGMDFDFTGLIFDLADLSTPLATLTAFDSNYDSGVAGLLVAADGNPGTADATFDNYVANVPEPSTAGLVLSGIVTAILRRRKTTGLR